MWETDGLPLEANVTSGPGIPTHAPKPVVEPDFVVPLCEPHDGLGVEGRSIVVFHVQDILPVDVQSEVLVEDPALASIF